MLALLLAVALQDTTGYDGRANRTTVDIPRIDSAVVIDGKLDDAVWRSAAKLKGFSQYQPVDGRAAEEPTEVLVFYSPEAIHFGIRATEIHGSVVRATRANRDDIASEDHVQILLDTDNGRQIAFLFGVNALGVQQDGTRSAQFAGGAGGAESRLRVRVEGSSRAPRLRGRSSHSLQEPALPGRENAELGNSYSSPHPAYGLPGYLGTRHQGERQLPRPGRNSRWVARHAAGTGTRGDSDFHWTRGRITASECQP